MVGIRFRMGRPELVQGDATFDTHSLIATRSARARRRLHATNFVVNVSL
jgi:hypothetical protein